MNPVTMIRSSWRKNWPEVYCGLTGGLPGFLFAKSPAPLGHAVPVFCYHVVDHDRFQQDLSFLAHNGYSTLTADQLLAHLHQDQPAPPNSVVLSIDDGQTSLYDVAHPLLKQFGFKAIAFICPGLHRDQNEPGEAPGFGLCTWSQIKAMHDQNTLDFQPHTHSHRYLPRWPRPLPLSGVDHETTDQRRPIAASITDDLRLAKDELERRLNKTAAHLAFPQYNGTAQAIRIGQGLGYRGFWWGTLPGRPLCIPGGPATHITRISGEFVRRLPGEGRVPLRQVLKSRYAKRFTRHRRTDESSAPCLYPPRKPSRGPAIRLR